MKAEEKTWHLVKHLKSPVTEDEIEISNILKKLAGSFMYKNFDYLEAVISEDAIFVSFKGKNRNKLEFLKWQKSKGFHLKRLMYLDVVITVVESVATVYYTRYLRKIKLGKIIEKKDKRCFEFLNQENNWKLVKSAPM